MAEAADADNADPGAGIDAVGAQGVVDGDAATEQRGRLLAGQGVGKGNGEAVVDANRIRVAAVAVDAGGFRGGAEVFEALGTPLALAATVGLPADADALADGEGGNAGADSSDGADDFVAGDEGVLADAPVVGDEVKVRVTDAAVGDADFNVEWFQVAGSIAKRQQFSASGVGCKSLNLAHNDPWGLAMVLVMESGLLRRRRIPRASAWKGRAESVAAGIPYEASVTRLRALRAG